MKRRALISVYEKEGIEDFCREISSLGWEIISTGGTRKLISSLGIDVVDISTITGFAEILGGRVKSLHPLIHGGILARRDNEGDLNTLQNLKISAIDMVVTNLYPFSKVSGNLEVSIDEMVELIDIGGHALIRSAAKNFKFVCVIVDKNDFSPILKELKENGEVSFETKFFLASKALRYAAYYDHLIATHFTLLSNENFPERITFGYDLKQKLRYGENPHQSASVYVSPFIKGGVKDLKKIQGKELSFNNYLDMDSAISIVREFTEPCCVIVKHTNPCGVATGGNINESFKKALSCDPQSAFGGIVCLNREVPPHLASEISEIFFEVVLAPSFSKESYEIFKKKKNLRVIEIKDLLIFEELPLSIREFSGGILIQQRDKHKENLRECIVVTKKKPIAEDYDSLCFAWKVCKYVKSNAVVIAKNGMTIGIGAGQMSRVDAVKIAISKSNFPLQGAVVASDAFFPFRDSIDELAKYKISAIVQPGGSIRDKEVIDACDDHNIAMIFTGFRHFKH